MSFYRTEKTPGSPIQRQPNTPQTATSGYGYVPASEPEREVFFYHSDHLGSTAYITDSNGAVSQFICYMPYGEALVDEHSASTEEQPYKFNGKEMDRETGLYYYGARYYDPSKSGVWYGIDPLTEKKPWLSPYVYCSANPIRFIDPDGRDEFEFSASAKLTTGILNLGMTIFDFSYSLGGVENELAVSISFDTETFDLTLKLEGIRRDVAEGSFHIGVITIGGGEQKTREKSALIKGGINLETKKMVGNIEMKKETKFINKESGSYGIYTYEQKNGEEGNMSFGIKNFGLGIGILGIGADANFSIQESNSIPKKSN